MRPQKLTLKNFMPFRSSEGQTQVVDFSNLDLFAITGPTGSGKSSLVDAIVWCLYGRTSRYSNDPKGVISTGEVLCEVAFEFSIGPRQFCAVRRTGKTTESGLTELLGGEYIQEISGADRLTERIKELLGLDFDSFTKTVILPQGQYAQFLSSEPKERRKLLEQILELGVYKRVAERAKTLETQTKERAKTIRETLAQPQYAGVTRAVVEQQRAERELLIQEIGQTATQEEELRELAQKAEVVGGLIGRLTELRKEEQTKIEERTLAQQKHAVAEKQLLSLVQALADIEAEQEKIGYDARRHEVIKRSSSYLHEYCTAGQEAETKKQASARVQQELTNLDRQLTEQVQAIAQTRRTYDACVASVQAHIAASGDVATLTEKLNQAKRWKELLRERQQLTERQPTLTQQIAQAQQALSALFEWEEVQEQELQTLQAQRDRTREQEQETRQQEVEAEHLAKDVQAADQEEKRAAQDAVRVRAVMLTIEQKLQQQRAVVAQAEEHEQAATRAYEENRKENAIAHLQTMLHVGEACPVCQTTVHEIPSASHGAQADQAILQQVLEEAKTALTIARQGLQKVETEAATAKAKLDNAEREAANRTQKYGEIQNRFAVRFPGFSSPHDALTSLQTQKRELVVRLKELETSIQRAEQAKKKLAGQRVELQRGEATAAEGLRNIASTLAARTEQITALEAALLPYRQQDSDPETELTSRRQQLVQAEKELRELEVAVRKEEGALHTLQNRKLQTEGSLKVLQSEYTAAAARVERAGRSVRENLELASDAPLPALSALERELAELAGKQESYNASVKRKESLRNDQIQTERNIAALGADLQVRAEFVQQAQRTIGQTEDELGQARTVLREAIQRSLIPDLDSDGANVKAQLTALHERGIALRERRSGLEEKIRELENRIVEKEQEEQKLREAETETRLASELGKLLGAGFTDFLSQGAVEALMRDASVHLQRLTHDRYALDIAYKSNSIELQIVDYEDHKRKRPTHSLSGGETFLASLAIALALSQGFREVATGKAGNTSTECLILDEGFGTLGREELQLVTETLQELRGEEGRMVGIITHIEEVAAAMPMRVEIRKGTRASTVAVTG